MSVCISAIAGRDENKEHGIITITDRKASSVEFSNEDATVKGMYISTSWLATFAGADISPAVPICRAVDVQVSKEDNTLEVVTKAFEFQYQLYLSNLATAKVLGRWKLTMDKFLETGRKKFGADVFDSLCSQIEQVKLQCQFLVSGFDGDRQPHIFSVRNPGIAANHDTPGYFAIGNGEYAAMSILGFFKQNVVTDLAKTVYNIFAAKLMAETASEVGIHPYFWHRVPDGFRQPDWGMYDIVATAWNSEGGRPSIPDGTLDKIKAMLEQDKKKGLIADSSG